MKRRLAILALALLFLLPACARQAKDDAYHWTPPEKKYNQSVTDGYDPASGMTYEEYLTTIDTPIVISVERFVGSIPLLEYELTREPASSYIKAFRNAPRVTDVSFPTLLHWLDNFCGEQIMQFPKEFIERNGIHRKDVQYAPMEKATLMIGQYQSALKEEQIGEGRKWTDMRECCVNRALYEKLLAYEKAEFTGLGDIITVTETLYRRGVMRETKKEGLNVLPVDKTIHEYTVVGIVEDEGEYANTDAYGFFHIYAPLDMVKNLIAKHDTQRPFYVDTAMYQIGQIFQEQKMPGEGVMGVYCRPSAEDPTKLELRLSGSRIIPEEEWLALFEDAQVNAGYTMEITLDSGKSYAEFAEYFSSYQNAGSTSPARNMYNTIYKTYEKNVEIGAENPQLNMQMVLQELEEAEELDDWFYYNGIPTLIRPLRVAGD